MWLLIISGRCQEIELTADSMALHCHEAKSQISKPSTKPNQNFGKINIHFVTNKNAHNNIPRLNLHAQLLSVPSTTHPTIGTINIFVLVHQKGITKQTVYCNVTALSYNHCCNAKAISIIYFVCVSEVLCIAKRMRRIVVCGLSGRTIFFHITSQMAWFKKKSYEIQNVCLDFLYNFRLKRFSFWEKLRDIW